MKSLNSRHEGFSMNTFKCSNVFSPYFFTYSTSEVCVTCKMCIYQAVIQTLSCFQYIRSNSIVVLASNFSFLCLTLMFFPIKITE